MIQNSIICPSQYPQAQSDIIKCFVWFIWPTVKNEKKKNPIYNNVKSRTAANSSAKYFEGNQKMSLT